MHGPPQAGRVLNDALVEHLEYYGYPTSNKTLGLWTHKSLSINFILVVDYFGVKYLGTPTHQINTGRKVQSHQRLRRKLVHCNLTTMVILKRHGPAIHTRICMCSTSLISTWKTQTTKRFTIRLDQTYIWKEQPDAEQENPAEELDENK